MKDIYYTRIETTEYKATLSEDGSIEVDWDNGMVVDVVYWDIRDTDYNEIVWEPHYEVIN